MQLKQIITLACWCLLFDLVDAIRNYLDKKSPSDFYSAELKAKSEIAAEIIKIVIFLVITILICFSK